MNLADDRRGVACTVLHAWPTLVRYTADMRDEVVVRIMIYEKMRKITTAISEEIHFMHTSFFQLRLIFT